VLDREHPIGERGFRVGGKHRTAPWITIGPLSSDGVTTCTVAPWSFTPAASARACVCKPGNAGRREGWMLRMRRGKRG
jgi:hypothetical protein